MALTNYSDLKSTIANYLARTDLTDQIPDFIRLAEVRLRRDLRIRQMMRSAVTTTTGGDSTVALPTDFLELRTLHVLTNPVRDLQFVSPAIFYRNGRVHESGLPVFYTIMATEFKFAPVPDGEYTLEILYYAAPDFMSNTLPSNVFMANCPDLLLYGALVEAEPYLMNDARIQLWAGMFDRGMAAINTADDRSEYSGVPIKMTLSAR
jgi:hypothetical protein